MNRKLLMLQSRIGPIKSNIKLLMLVISPLLSENGEKREKEVVVPVCKLLNENVFFSFYLLFLYDFCLPLP